MNSYHCPLCQGCLDDWQYVNGDYYRHTHTPYLLYWCVDCQYGCLNPRPSPQEIPNFYQFDSYYTHKPVWIHSQRKGYLQRLKTRLAWETDRSMDLADSVLQKIGRTQRKRICDFGCGNGSIMQILMEAGHDVVGIEVDPEAVAVTRSKGLRVYQSTFDTLPDQVKNLQFDICIISHVLEHCLEPVNVIKNVGSLLVPGGFIVCEVPNNQCKVARKKGPYWRWLDVPRHLNFFTPKSIVDVFIRAGFKVESLEFCGYTRMFSSERVLEEQQIEDFQQGKEIAEEIRWESQCSNWSLLLRTQFARDEDKYDSVRGFFVVE